MIDRRLASVLLRKKLRLPTSPSSTSLSSSTPSSSLSSSRDASSPLTSSPPDVSKNLLSCGCRVIFFTPIDCTGFPPQLRQIRQSSSGAPPPPPPPQLRQVRQSSSGASPPPPPNRYNHYETLGVGEFASPQEIKKAFYSLSKRCHPDLHPDDERMAEKFKSLTTAYDVLINKDKRDAYDIEKNIRRSNQQRWHGYSSNKYYPVAKGKRPQVSYTTADISRRKDPSSKSRRFDSNLGDLGDSEKDVWIRQQHRKMKERLEDEDRQFKEEWKQMMGVRSGLTPGEPGFRPDGLTEEEQKRWQEFQNKLEERRKAEESELAFQNQRISQHPALYYFYNMKYDWVEWTLWPLGLIGGLIFIFYVLYNKPSEEMPYKTMKAQFEEEGRLHKLKMAEKKQRQRLLEELMRERSLQNMKIETEEEEEEEVKEVKEDGNGVVTEEVLGDESDVKKVVTQNVESTDTTISETAPQPNLVQLSEHSQKSSTAHQESVLQPRQLELRGSSY